jgi:hypothetical protein
MFFPQNIDVRMKFRYSVIIFDHQVDGKTSHFNRNIMEYIWTNHGMTVNYHGKGFITLTHGLNDTNLKNLNL